MKERPIIFSGPMVRAILDGRKTQTRRIIKNPKRLNGLMLAGEEPAWCPYGGPGDWLYVRESFRVDFDFGKHYSQEHQGVHSRHSFESYTINYKADGHSFECHFLNGDPVEGTSSQMDYEALARMSDSGPEDGYRPSIHMPKAFARIWLKVEEIRIERVQDITASEIEKEGAITENTEINDALPLWINLWNSINQNRGFGWDKNPWVWIVEFSVISTTGRPEVPHGR